MVIEPIVWNVTAISTSVEKKSTQSHIVIRSNSPLQYIAIILMVRCAINIHSHQYLLQTIQYSATKLSMSFSYFTLISHPPPSHDAFAILLSLLIRVYINRKIIVVMQTSYGFIELQPISFHWNVVDYSSCSQQQHTANRGKMCMFLLSCN